MVDNVTVTQEDRDAAASCGRATQSVSRGEAAAIRRGEWDDLPRVQWFANYRLARLSPAPEGVDAREAIKDCYPCNGTGIVRPNDFKTNCANCGGTGVSPTWAMSDGSDPSKRATADVSALSRPPAEQVRMREIEPANPAHAAVLSDLARRIDDE